MQQFYEPPKRNSRHQVQHLFPSLESNPQTPTFVPFNQERDKLGHLISKENKSRLGGTSRFSFASLGTRNCIPKPQLSARETSGDKTVERIFKMHSIPSLQINKDKLRLGTGMKKMNSMPCVGQYEIATATDKYKYKRSNETPMRFKPEIQTTQLPRRASLQIPKLSLYRHQDEQKPSFLPKQKSNPSQDLVQLNHDLPQLQKFHKMQKLQLSISQNFEKGHERFNKLAQQSLFLANRIKRQLQFD